MLIQADAAHIPLASESVQCIVTSPPYWGLRDYGIAGQLGLEPTPELYVASMVAVFRECWRVLRKDGTCWVNLGDSYAANRAMQVPDSNINGARSAGISAAIPPGLKPKDLVGIPWRVAFALQADGWYLRQDIIWSKPGPMPESVRDRCTKSHEYLFLLSKNPRYYYDADAIKEPVAASSIERLSQPGIRDQIGSARVPGKTNGNMKAVGDLEYRNKRSVWEVATQPFTGWTKTVRWERVSAGAISGDTVRIASRDCPYHGDRFVLVASALCGEHAADYLIHNFDKRGHLFPGHVVDSVPIVRLLEHLIESDNSGFLSPVCALSANDHNSETHKKVHALLTNPSCIVCGKKPLHTARKIEELLKDDSVVRKLLNNSEPDDLAYHPLVQTLLSNEDISSCCCSYYAKKTQETSHFATFPEDLVKPCILAGTSHKGCCPECFAPWERVVEKERTKDPTRHTGRAAVGCNDRMDADEPRMLTESRTLGWEPGCECSVTPGLIGETGAVAAIEPFRPVACRVLDPFSGSGTVVKVAQDLGRVGIGLDLKPEYLKMGQKRISQLGFGAIAN